MLENILSGLGPQDDSMRSVAAMNPQPTSIPLLTACTVNVKTVVANPIVYLTNLTHDILQTINALDSPPHPDVVNNEVGQLVFHIRYFVQRKISFQLLTEPEVQINFYISRKVK